MLASHRVNNESKPRHDDEPLMSSRDGNPSPAPPDQSATLWGRGNPDEKTAENPACRPSH